MSMDRLARVGRVAVVTRLRRARLPSWLRDPRPRLPSPADPAPLRAVARSVPDAHVDLVAGSGGEGETAVVAPPPSGPAALLGDLNSGDSGDLVLCANAKPIPALRASACEPGGSRGTHERGREDLGTCLVEN